MPILVVCPSCGTKLNAPDSGAGKRVRCPMAGCGTLAPVPEPVEAEEVEVVDAALAPPKSQPLRAAVADDEDDDRPRKRRRGDEDDEDRPPRRRRRDDDDDYDRPRRRRGASRDGSGTGKVVAIVLGSLLLLGGVGTGVYFLAFNKSSPPKGWKEYTYADAGFKAYFPTEPTLKDNVLGTSLVYTAHSTEDGVPVTVTVLSLRLPPNMSPEQAEVQMNKQLEYHAKNPPGKGRVVGLRSVTWMGHPAKELRIEAPEDAKRDPYGAAFTRYVVTNTHQFIAVIDTPDRRKLSSSTINGFFDNIQPLGK